jgi:hypothetical protein
MTEDELIARVTREIMDLSSKFDADNYADAVDEAESETGFTCPVTAAFQIRWLKARTKRALFFMLMSGAAKKVRYEQINLDQAFGHYRQLILDMDKEFDKALQENCFEFAGVAACHMFGSKIDAGFQYDPLTGVDTTYTTSNRVVIQPEEADS